MSRKEKNVTMPVKFVLAQAESLEGLKQGRRKRRRRRRRRKRRRRKREREASRGAQHECSRPDNNVQQGVETERR